MSRTVEMVRVTKGELEELKSAQNVLNDIWYDTDTPFEEDILGVAVTTLKTAIAIMEATEEDD